MTGGAMPTSIVSDSTLRNLRSPLFVAVAAFLPWLLAVLALSGVRTAWVFALYGALVTTAGYSVVSVLASAARRNAMLLAPAVGIVLVSSVVALGLRVGVGIAWAPVVWCVLALAGLPGLWRDRRQWIERAVPFGAWLGLLSLLICGLYFVPAARRDAVRRQDGGFNWIYVDTQFFYAISAELETGILPPRIPGTYEEVMRYHFAPYVSAAVLARTAGIPLGDSFARVTRGASLWALVLSTFGLGLMLARMATGAELGGILGVAGLFFYGSMGSLFTDAPNSSGYVTGALLYKIQALEVPADGGPFAHLILGHSMLHGLIAVTMALGLCLALGRSAGEGAHGQWILLLVPALAVPMNSVAALVCMGGVATLLFADRWKSRSAWLQGALMAIAFFAAWKLMDYSHAGDLRGGIFDLQPYRMLGTVAMEIAVGLGFRLLALRWVRFPLRNPVATLVLLVSCGLVAFFLALSLNGNERYGLYFLQAIFSIFAFAQLKPGFWRAGERAKWTGEWLRVVVGLLLVLAIGGVALGAAASLAHVHTDIPYFSVRLAIVVGLLVVLSGLAWLHHRGGGLQRASSAVVMAVLAVGFLGWITPWLNYGMGRARRDVSLTPGEVQGLIRLRSVSSPGDLFATNKHAVDSLVSQRERSYGYGALAERPVLLEGYLDHGVTMWSRFPALIANNDAIFTTIDPAMLRRLAESYHVRWLVARPGTDIALPRPLPQWLQEEPDTGSLKVYEIEPEVGKGGHE
jgi:hypothetical protein